MHSRIVGKFGMERGSHHLPLPHRHRIVALGGDHFTSDPTRSILGARMNTISIGDEPDSWFTRVPLRMELSTCRP